MNISIKVKRSQEVAYRVIEGEAIIADPKSGLIYPLNGTATRIWELLDGEKSCQEIIRIIEDEFSGDTENLQKDILGFIQELLDKGLAIILTSGRRLLQE